MTLVVSKESIDIGHFVSAMPPKRSSRLRDEDITRLLDESEMEDFAPSDEDGMDPEYEPLASILSPPDNHSSESSDSEGEVLTEAQDIRGRGTRGRRARGSGRGGRARGSRGNRRSRGRGTRRGIGAARSRSQLRRPENEVSEDSSTSDSNEPSINGNVPPSNWDTKEFSTRFVELMQPSYPLFNSEGFKTVDYWKQYIDDELVRTIVENTNRTSVEKTGRTLHLTVEETYMYIGITFVMGSVNYPNLRMYWENKWRIPIIADNMSRNRFFLLRNSLKVVFDADISPEIRTKDKFWKVRPLITRIQNGCRNQNKEQSLSIDEMIIPFTGSCVLKQYCPGKPNPVGIKAFVLANPDGTVCDFHLYEGQTTYPNYDDTNFGLGEKAVLTLADPLVPGHILYFDRYFTSEKLLDELERRGIRGTGTLMKNRIPKDVRELVISDKELKIQGRGSSQVLVRKDNGIAFTKWFDNKPVLFLSSMEANGDEDTCKRWCKRNKVYVTVPRPRVVRQYNQKMGGVDLADRLMAVCPYRYRTRKWTQRMFASMIDLAVTNSWLQFKNDQLKLQVPVKKVQQLRAFKMEMGEILIESYSMISDSDTTAGEEEAEIVVHRKKPNSIPSVKFRTHKAEHMPHMVPNVGRCRQCHYNRTYFKCRTCDISLCLTRHRNCFADFHEKAN